MSIVLASFAIVISSAVAVYWYFNRHKPIKYVLREFIQLMDMNGAGAGGIIDDWLNVGNNKVVLPDAKRKVGVVTGGARGIGAEVIRGMLKANMTVVIGIRLPELATKLAKSMENGDNLHAYKLDLQSLKSVKEFAENVLKNYPEINVLVNNAGIMFGDFTLTEDGFETQLAVNYLGHFYLTHLLLPALKKGGSSATARIVNVTSCGHYAGKINFEDINMKKHPEYYDTTAAYAQSKLAQLMAARYMNNLFEEERIPIKCYAVHPGIVDTDLFEKSLFRKVFPWLMKLCFKTPEKGAISILYACFEESLEKKGGLYISNCKEGISNRFSKNIAHQKKLYELSCKLVSIDEDTYKNVV